MAVLILVQDYPNKDRQYTMNFVHTRNLEYKENGVDIVVLSFQATESYQYDSIQVLSEKSFLEKYNNKKFDIVISHAPNIRNHIRFLKKYNRSFNNIILFFHGHEVMKMSKYYPAPYSFVKEGKLKKIFQNIYDDFKLAIMKSFIQSQIKKGKLKMVFVSEWMRDVFISNVKVNKNLVFNHSNVIPNSMNTVFLEKSYLPKNDFKADFVTIRPLDKSKYAVDVVVRLAEKYPNLTFHLFGKGNYFTYNDKPKNLKVFDKFMKPDELIEVLNHYKCALMPTRLDAQGVMMCEIASYGMPIITSDIPICKEMLRSFSNVYYLNNEDLNIDLNNVLNQIDLNSVSPLTKEVFSFENTIQRELILIKSALER
ncbi:hypothetical protein K0H71_12625 [Bacillus sp. IITD106]|nr:hypothetical protein [Bacillus sp. IITD106]